MFESVVYTIYHTVKRNEDFYLLYDKLEGVSGTGGGS